MFVGNSDRPPEAATTCSRSRIPTAYASSSDQANVRQAYDLVLNGFGAG